jgi:hypothetical protein
MKLRLNTKFQKASLEIHFQVQPTLSHVISMETKATVYNALTVLSVRYVEYGGSLAVIVTNPVCMKR